MTLAFSAVVGQEQAKRALLLAALDPTIGGVLLRGDKGSAKTTLARGLAALLGEAPFVELPLGATEDRVLGSLDVGALLERGEHRFTPGLLSAADGGVLYVDEVNLLADHLVDVLLDVAATGVVRVEREGVSHEEPADFVLVASMNPEEGELRPQLLDRFGLAVEVRASSDPTERALAVRRQLADDDGARTGKAEDLALAALLSTKDIDGVVVPDEVVEGACRLALEVGAEGLRADLMLSRAARANATWEGRTEATVADVLAVAPLVLGHRRRRTPFEEPGISQEELDQAASDAGLDPEPESEGATGGEAAPQHGSLDPGPERTGALARKEPRSTGSARSGRSATAEGPRGRTVGAAGWKPGDPVAPRPTAIAAATRAAGAPSAVRLDDLRAERKVEAKDSLVVVVVDTSGSMGAQRRLEAAGGVVLGVLGEAYRRRDRVALIACGGEEATLALRPTGSVEVARARLAALTTGGPTPLGSALARAHELFVRDHGVSAPVLVVITDGRATAGGEDPVTAASDEAMRLARLGVRSVVIDAEDGIPRLGLAAQLAAQLGGEVRPIDAPGTVV